VTADTLTLYEPAPMLPALAFTVYGQAKPGGSKRAFLNPKTQQIVVIEDSKNKPWRAEVVAAAAYAMDNCGIADPLLGPLAVELRFYRPRPKGHYGSGRNSGVIKASAPAYPTTRPDVLKLARLVEDAMAHVVYADDAQIVDEHLLKLWGSPERCEVHVRCLEPCNP